MYNFTVNFDTTQKKPLYQQLYEYIAREIREKRLDENEKMPSKRALSSHLGISVNTIETAYEILVQEGYLDARPRSGFYVRYIDTPIKKAVFTEEKQEENSEKYRADFRTNAVDIKSFPYATWVKLSKEIMYNNPELLEAGNGKGDYELRRNIAKYLTEFRGVSCAANQVIVGAGIEYLLMIIMELLGEKRVYAMENPGYGKINTLLKNNGLGVRYIELDENGISVKKLCKTDAEIVYITPSHQFPTGIVMPVDRRIELLKWAKEKKGRYIIEDDYNSEFNFSKKPVTALQGISGGENVIYLNTFSRALAPSIRVAYMVLPIELLEIYEQRFSGYSPTVSSFEQRTLSRFISEEYMSRHLNRVKNIYKKRRDALIEAFAQSPYDVKISGERAGLHIIVKGSDTEKIVNAAKKNGIKLYCEDDYYFTPHKAENVIIAGYAGVTKEDIALLAEVLT